MGEISRGRGQLLYLAHASEDKPVVRAVGKELERRGWAVWLDEAELIIGRSLRTQLDEGMARSRFGIVFLGANFFAKRWPKVELDAIFAMEDDGRTRFLPVNLDLSRSELLDLSPITASRYYATWDGDAAGLAEVLSKSMSRVLGDEGSFADTLRGDIFETLPWYGAPNFFDDSLDYLDANLSRFIGNERLHLEPREDTRDVASVLEVLERAPQYNGRPIYIVGLQHTVQLLRDYSTFGDWVFQLSDVEGSISPYGMYVRYFGPPAHTGYTPKSPPGDLTLALGTVLARGPMRTVDGDGAGVYTFAARLTSAPVPESF